MKLMLTIQFGHLLIHLKLLKTKTTLGRILNIRITTNFIPWLMPPNIPMYLNILILRQLSHLNLQRQIIKRIPKRRLDIYHAIVDKNVLKVGLEENHTAADG